MSYDASHRCSYRCSLSAATLVCCLQVKWQGTGCGDGGDWALKVDAAKHQPSHSNPSDADATEDTPKQPRRVSVLFYIADEEGRGLTLQDANRASSDGARLFSSGQHAVAGEWQLYVNSPGKARLLFVLFSLLCHVGSNMGYDRNCLLI